MIITFLVFFLMGIQAVSFILCVLGWIGVQMYWYPFFVSGLPIAHVKQPDKKVIGPFSCNDRVSTAGCKFKFVTPTTALFHSTLAGPLGAFPSVRGKIDFNATVVSLRGYWPMAPFLFVLSSAGRVCMIPFALDAAPLSKWGCVCGWFGLLAMLALYFRWQRIRAIRVAESLITALTEPLESA